MKFKVGDKVRIKTKEEIAKAYGGDAHNMMCGWCDDMDEYCGKMGTVGNVDKDDICVDFSDGDYWYYGEKALEAVESPATIDDIEKLEECAMKEEEKKENNATTAIKAAMNVLGIKKGTKIDLYDEHGKGIGYSPYKFDGKKLVDNEGDSSEMEMGKLIIGRYTFKIVEEGKFIPENGEEYWYVDEDGDVAYIVSDEDEVDAARIAFGNAFETESIARDNVKNVLDKVHKVFNEEDGNKEDC